MTILLEKAVRLIAIVVLAFEMPVPIYWLILHTPVSFWRRHVRAAFPVAVLIAWGIVEWALYRFRLELFRRDVSFWRELVGAALIAFAAIAGMNFVASTINNAFSKIGNKLSNAIS